jgi:parvulin-like peptidyl-prolyl isomerase
MKKALSLALLAMLAAAAQAGPKTEAALDSVYQLYVARDWDGAHQMLVRLEAGATNPADKFACALELGDYLLDKAHDYAGAEAAYSKLLAKYPKQKQVPDVLYRLALAQEMQEKFLDAARNYEKVATRYSKSTYGTDALDAIERCFRKNYQDRVAYIDSFPMTRIEIDDRISKNPTAYESYDKKVQLLDTMVDNRLLSVAAMEAHVAEDSAFSFNLGEARNRAMFQEWYEREVNSKAEPTDKQLRAAYKKDLATKYTTPEKVHAYQILVKTKPEAESLRRLLKTDTALVWDSVARKSSLAPDKDRGGDMGLFARGVQPKPVEDAAYNLKVGDISRPVATKDGFVILKVTEKQPRSVRKYDDVRSQLVADYRQENTGKLYESKIAELKKQASITTDTTAIAENKDTLAIVNGIVIDQATLAVRLNAIPPFFRGQFDTPEGKQRLLDQLILEKLLMKEAERRKLWLVNKVVDQLLTRRSQLAIDTYRRMTTTDKVALDSAALMADYKATIKDFKEPTKVHLREIVAKTQARADQLRAWAKAGRLPVLLQGRALLVPDSAKAFEMAHLLEQTANTDSLLSQAALALPPALLTGTPTVAIAGKQVPDMSVKHGLAGPFAGKEVFSFGFSDLSKDDRLYRPELVTVGTFEQLDSLLGKKPMAESAAAPAQDSAKLGIYVKLEQRLPADYVSGLFKLTEKAVAKPYRTPYGWLVVKVTKKDTAQKAALSDVAKRFSTASSRWSGGDLYWLAKDDKAHDARLVDAGFALEKNGISPVLKLNDSSYTFVQMEERKDAFTRPFSEVKGKIENKLRRAQEKELYDGLLKNLRAAARIDILMKESDFVVEPLPEEAQPTETKEQPKQK